ncbi:MAG: hypothetical protein ABUT20_33535 [Bacteroidota bacterium]
MIIKNNDATLNRPEGDRILDAPYVFFDIRSALNIIRNEKAWHEGDRNAITTFKSDGLTITVTALKKDAVVDKIQVEGFTTLQVLEGQVNIKTPDGNMKMIATQVMVFHPSVQYTITALNESSFLLSHYNSFSRSGDIL